MGGLFLRIRTWWETADRTQKVVTLFGGSFLAVLLAGAFYFGTRPKMALAWGGLTPADQGKVVAEIQKLGIPVEYDLRGGVLVPSNKVAEVQAVLSRNGVAPTSGHMGNSELANIGMMSTKNVEDARLKAIKEGEVAKSIEVIGGVASARVLISGGERSPFAGESEPTSASVTVTERPGASLGGDEAKAIASLVARSVPGLTTKNVTIVNQEGTTLFDGAIEEGQQGKYTAKLEAQINEARRIKRELQPILDDAFGPNNTLITTRVEMDFDEATERSIVKKPTTKPVNETTAAETLGDGVSLPGGISGAVSNLPGAPAANPAAGGEESAKYKLLQSDRQFATNEIHTDKVKAPGTITSLAISVLVDSAAVKDVQPVKDLLAGYLGPKQKDPNYSFAVTSAEFDRTDDKKVAEAAATVGSRERLQQMMSMLPIAALVLVAFVVIRALNKAAKSSGNVMIQALPDGRLVTVGGKPGGALPAALMRSGGGVSEMAYIPAEGEEAEDDIYEEVDDKGQSTWKPKKRKKGPRPEDIEDIPDQINVPLEQIKKMGTERPQVAAMLIKSWLITD
jgi:flagellar basal-body M-ring protein/flagellar hook-basal body protein fliF